MSLFSFKYLWPRSVVHVDLTLFVYLWANLLHYARELSHFYLFIALVFILFFFFFVGQRRSYASVFLISYICGPAKCACGFFPFCLLVGSRRLWEWVYPLLNICGSVELCVWVFPCLFICGPVALCVWVFPLINICGPAAFVSMGLSLYKYL